MLIQQGDILVKSISEIPLNVKKITPSKRGYILAEGESTGHAHVIVDTNNVEMFISDEQTYLKVLNEIAVTHEEHKTITVEPGIYTIGKVLEYDHFLEEARKVQD